MRLKSINRQILAGHIGNEVKLRSLANNDPVLEFNVATTNSWKDKADQWHNDTEWHVCVFYRDRASAAAEMFKKGDAIYVEGRTETREWTAKDKSTRKRKEIIVDTFHRIFHEKTAAEEPPAAPAGEESPPNMTDKNTAGFDTGR